MSNRPTLKPFHRHNLQGDLSFAIGFLVLSVVLLSLIGDQTTWKPAKPLVQQPAFWPGIGLSMMVIFGAFHALSVTISARVKNEGSELFLWLRAVEFVLWLGAYVWLVPKLGYLPSTLLFTVGLTLREGYRSLRAIGFAVLTAVTIVVVFRGLLAVKIPAGAAYRLLPEPLSLFFIQYL